MYSNEQAQDIFTFLPIEVFLDHRLTLIETRILGALFSFRSKDTNTCWPHRKTLADRCGYSEKSISNNTKGLIEKGWVKVQQRRGSNIFTLTVPDLDTVTDSVTVPDSGTVPDPGNQDHRYCPRTGEHTVPDPGTPELTKNLPSKSNLPIRARRASAKDIAVYLTEWVNSDEKRSLDYMLMDLHNEAEKIHDHYESIGWVYGRARAPLKDWKAAARNWIRRSLEDRLKDAKHRQTTTMGQKDDLGRWKNPRNTIQLAHNAKIDLDRERRADRGLATGDDGSDVWGDIYKPNRFQGSH